AVDNNGYSDDKMRTAAAAAGGTIEDSPLLPMPLVRRMVAVVRAGAVKPHLSEDLPVDSGGSFSAGGSSPVEGLKRQRSFAGSSGSSGGGSFGGSGGSPASRRSVLTRAESSSSNNVVRQWRGSLSRGESSQPRSLTSVAAAEAA
ncbi:unnamed protein product, partial [Phaeothamnion confervicola]